MQGDGRGPLTLRSVACSTRILLFMSSSGRVELLKNQKINMSVFTYRGSICLRLCPGIHNMLVPQKWHVLLQGDDRLSTGRLCSNT